MTNHVLNYGAVQILILVLLSSLIVNLSSQSFAKDKQLNAVGSEYQIESSLLDQRHHQEEEDIQVPPTANEEKHYHLIDTSSQRPMKLDGWKGKKLRRAFEQEFYGTSRKPTVTFENNDRLLVDYTRKPPQEDKMMAASTNDDLRSGHYYDSYGDWHHGPNADSSTHLGNGDHHPTVAAHGHGYSLAGLNLLNPLILVATLSFIISLINAVLGVVDKIRLPVVSARKNSSVFNRMLDEEYVSDLEKVINNLHKYQEKSA